MAEDSRHQDTAAEIGTHLPYLRRYARALTGRQDSGDHYAAASLEAILADRGILDSDLPVKVNLFKVLHDIWRSSSRPDPGQIDDPLQRAAWTHMSGLTENTREALLLHTIEEMPYGDVAAIMGVDQAEAERLVALAHKEMAESMSGRILIIEDEAVIAMDLESLVTDLGHQVTAIARTRAGAVEKGARDRPDLILADIRLADNSSGIDAVRDLMREFGEIPVIFITAYPERLLTGDRPEPAFLISKPYKEKQVRSAVSQAMFFSSTAHVVE